MKASELFPDTDDRDFVKMILEMFDGTLISVVDKQTGKKIFP